MEECNVELQETINECQETLYSMSFVSPHYSSKVFTLQNGEPVNDNDSTDEIIVSDIVLNAKVSRIIDAKAIKGELCFFVELSNKNLTVISSEAANRLISDKKMIRFLTQKIKSHKYNSIPKLSNTTISTSQIPVFQCPYSITSENSEIPISQTQTMPIPPEIPESEGDDAVQINIQTPKARSKKKMGSCQLNSPSPTSAPTKNVKDKTNSVSVNDDMKLTNDQTQQAENDLTPQSQKKKRKRH